MPQYRIIDTQSKNGVFVNDRKIENQLLSHGDRITFGGPPGVKIGDFKPQPLSEFVYKFEIEYKVEQLTSHLLLPQLSRLSTSEEKEDDGIFEFMSTFREKAEFVIWWGASLGVVWAALFGESGLFTAIARVLGITDSGLMYFQISIGLLVTIGVFIAFILFKRRKQSHSK